MKVQLITETPIKWYKSRIQLYLFLLSIFLKKNLVIKARIAIEEIRRLVEGEGRDTFISGLVKKVTSTMLSRFASRFSTTIERYFISPVRMTTVFA